MEGDKVAAAKQVIQRSRFGAGLCNFIGVDRGIRDQQSAAESGQALGHGMTDPAKADDANCQPCQRPHLAQWHGQSPVPRLGGVMILKQAPCGS